jgi:hypothetical protein
VAEIDEERAVELGGVLVDLLRLLNRSEEEGSTVEGLEHVELLHLLRQGSHPALSVPELDAAIATLLGNGFARELDVPEYAWDRGRTLGRRFALTLPGKQYLIVKDETPGRIR